MTLAISLSGAVVRDGDFSVASMGGNVDGGGAGPPNQPLGASSAYTALAVPSPEWVPERGSAKLNLAP